MKTKVKASREAVRKAAIESLRKRFLNLAWLRDEIQRACPNDQFADDGIYQAACDAAWEYADEAVKEMKRRHRQRRRT